MLTRRDFLRRSTIALAGGLVLGDEAMEAFARLTHQRTSFPSATVHHGGPRVLTDAELSGVLKKVYESFRPSMQDQLTPMLANVQRASYTRYAPVNTVYYTFEVPRGG